MLKSHEMFLFFAHCFDNTCLITLMKANTCLNRFNMIASFVSDNNHHIIFYKSSLTRFLFPVPGHITQPQSAATGGNYLHPHSTDENIRNHSYVTQTQSLQPDDFIHIERSPNNKNNNNNTKMSNKLASTDVGFNNENEVFEPQQFSNNYVSRQQMNGEYFDNAYLTHDDSIAVDQVQKPISSSATRSNATRSRPGAEVSLSINQYVVGNYISLRHRI